MTMVLEAMGCLCEADYKIVLHGVYNLVKSAKLVQDYRINLSPID